MIKNEVYKNKLILKKEKAFYYNKKLSSSNDAINFIRNILRLYEEPEEVLYVIGLDTKLNVNSFIEVARGELSLLTTTGREIFKRVILMNCNKIILTHNHPSGDVKPSKKDLEFTKKMSEISNLLSIELIDHIIIGENENYSILAEKTIK